MTEHLDRAIEAAEKATEACVQPNTWMHADNRSHDYARALIADLLRDMDEPPLDPPAILGWDLALTVIKRRAGLEGEG